MLEVTGLKVAYGSVEAVQLLDLSVGPQDALALLGANGAGKTSSVEAIAGLLPTKGGRVHFDGKDVTGRSASAMARLGLALVPQWRELFPNFTVDETLKAAVSAARGRPPLPAEHVFALFPVLGERRNQLAGSLSGGEQQMLAIGRALVTNPRIMLLDEPSAGLAVGIARSLVGIIERIRDSGVGIVIVEQNLEIAKAVARRCIVLSAGRMVWSGSMEDAAASAQIEQAYFA